MRLNTLFIITLVSVLACSNYAQAGKVGDSWRQIKEAKWKDGRTRLELQGWASTRSGRRSRTGDLGFAGTIEREFIVGSKTTVGLRAIPLFYMEERDHDYFDDFDGDGIYEHATIKGNSVYAVGVGVSIRHYFRDLQDGFFFEFYESFFAQSDNFQGNTGSFNFMSELGLGYEFDNNIHVAVKWRHMSNGGIADKNAGINSVGIGVGFSF
ncbi:acyloxyacyl hydrolase [bacterium AH-315-P07]|nr:acyloxyacyl hydrolase [bacterium AH-315-P07]